tara:strand:- start:744 stop:2894 length:2151 start_codon:yes stop_codon:yes gene_type:complete
MNLKSLNINQRKAVEKIGGPILVFAGAGSGKTRVLTYKIAYLISEVGILPENILAVTFTNKAAQEMKSRVSQLVSSEISGISIGTFHSISAHILRRDINLLGYNRDFTIYDQQDSKALVKNVIKKLNLDIKQFDPKSMQIRISNAKNQLHSMKYIEDSIENYTDKKFHQIYSEYQNELKLNNSVDFDDLLLLPIEIFKNNPEKLNYYQSKYKYVLVDEYQDTNKPQFEFVHLISSIHKDIFVVGDDDQSIYGWRGADISNILNFQEAFGQSEIYKLEQNYRSTKNILEAAWSVVSKNTHRSEKKLWTDNNDGEKLDIIAGFDERDEAKKILDKIVSNKYKLNESSILYRTNSQSRAIEDELRKSGIAYHIVGGVKFYERKEIKDLICYLRVIVNSDDSISLDRIINFPPRGLGVSTVSKINEFREKNNMSFFASIQDCSNIGIPDKQLNTINDFNKLINKYRKQSLNEKGSQILDNLLNDIKLKDYYYSQKTDEALNRWENIQEFLSSIVEYESNNPNSTLASFLEEVSLLTDIDKWNDSNDAITLMTVHSAKGLEFDCVYISGLEDGLFPIVRYLEDTDIEEERRLFYVALTRSKKKVVLSYAKSRRKFGSDPILSVKSRFIDDIPEDLIYEKIVDKSNFYNNKVNIFSKLSKPMNNNIKVGNLVEHKIFGKGKVLYIDGQGENSKLTIKFYNNVTKKLILKYAKLKLLKDTYEK